MLPEHTAERSKAEKQYETGKSPQKKKNLKEKYQSWRNFQLWLHEEVSNSTLHRTSIKSDKIILKITTFLSIENRPKADNKLESIYFSKPARGLFI